ncbi:PAS domain-containing protein [Verrucomicrobium sp. GAS474]|uniref:ATP-binding protein n=1 Tax=Verrucomicrobium sp. GAS474 TaxID=1882831 RepID=UPI00087BD2C9|nr:ATP-binding protein [Verrucomicrobium sp. GAS474]SDT93142.1 PAS domain-containing protein [Verrucomicrobium sp. GAS474]
MSLASYLVSAAFLLNLVLAFSVASRGIKRPTNQAFLFLSVCIATWLSCVWIGLQQTIPEKIEPWIRICTVSGLFMPLSLYILCDAIITQLPLWTVLRRNVAWSLFIIGGTTLAFTRFFLISVTAPYSADGFINIATPNYGPGFLLYSVAHVSIFIFTVIRGIRIRKRLRGITQVELDYALLGVLVFNGLAMTSAGIAPLFLKNSQVIQLPPLWVLILDLIIAYGISTRRLLGISTLARLLASYTLWIIYLSALYALTWWTTKAAFNFLTFDNLFLAHLIPTIVVTLSMAPAKSISQKVIHKLFVNPGNIDLKKGLQLLGNLSLETRSIEEFSLRSLQTMASIAGTDTGSIHFFCQPTTCHIGESLPPSEELLSNLRSFISRSPQNGRPIAVHMLPRQLNSDDPMLRDIGTLQAALIIGIFSESTPVGIILLGERLTGKFYDQEDVDSLQLLANHLTSGLSIIRLYSELSQNSLYQSTVLDQLIDGIISSDSDGRITVLNRESKRIMGDLLPKEGAHIRTLPKPIGELFEGVLTTGDEIGNKEILFNRSDRPIPIRIACRRLTNEQGKVLGASLICHDLSEIKLLERHLLQADRMASLGNLSASVAHEIKNPLVAMKTFVQLLPERFHDKNFLAHFSTIIGKEINRIDGIVNQLLVWAKPAAQKTEMLDISEVVSSMLALYRLEITKNRIHVKLNLPQGPLLVLGRRQGIQQALSNLILNAIQAMKDGGHLTLTAESVDHFDGTGMIGHDSRLEDPSPEIVIVTVQDTGDGIPPEIIPKLFQPFITSKSDGNGLGLSIVREIIQAHHAAIFIETVAGKGTSFKLVFC